MPQLVKASRKAVRSPSRKVGSVKRERSRLTDELVETVQGLRRAGLMQDEKAKKITMRLLDEGDVPKFYKVSAREVARTREKVGVSQPVFAKYLGVSPSVIAKWERGSAAPSQSAQYVIRLVERKGLKALRELGEEPGGQSGKRRD